MANNMVFIVMQFFTEDELGQGMCPDLFRNQEETNFCDRIVQLEGLISITMTGSAFAIKVCGDQLDPRNRIGWFTAHLEIDPRTTLRVILHRTRRCLLECTIWSHCSYCTANRRC